MNDNLESTRRDFIRQSAAASAAVCVGDSLAADVSPIRTIYSNDTTHMLSCQRPEARSEVLTDEMVIKSIKEAAGVDAHFLQPGLGWVPWWKSEVYSVEEHYRWLASEHGIKGATKIDRYLLGGGDLLDMLVNVCRQISVAPFLSFRLNDGHHTRDLEKALKRGKPTVKMSRHFWDNYQKYRIGPDVSNWGDAVFDWSIEAVRDHKFALIEEACANYDIAGLELDFLRHLNRFSSKIPLTERSRITNDFVRRIRRMLDRTATALNLPRRKLCIRVPANDQVRWAQGIELGELCEAGVDMVNLSYSYFTWQDESVASARKEVGAKPAIYVEMTHCTLTGKATNGSGTQPFLRTTANQFYTTAQLAFEQGATGVSLFNFPYYRYHVTDTIGPFHEPPFEVISKLSDRAFLAAQRPWYFLTAGRKDPVLGERELPVILKRGETGQFSFLLSEVLEHSGDGLLRLRSDESIRDRELLVTCAGERLEEVNFVEQPIEHPYDETWLGTGETVRCFQVPQALVSSPDLKISVAVKKGIRVRFIYLDLVF